ncbi:MAG: phenylacetate-CoA oxygenase/reductase subunit PaaK [Pseudomonadota bacterium]
MTDLHFHPLRVRSVEADTAEARVVTFEPVDGEAARWHFQPGQHLTLRATVGGQELRRSYSLCAAPGEPLRVGVRRVAGGAFSSWLHQQLRPGDLVDAMPPQGAFGRALALAPRHVLAVAGGSGITPMLSILKSHLRASPANRVTLVYANRTAASTMFAAELDDLKNRHLARLAVFPVFSREQVDAPLAAGRLDAARLGTILRLVGGAAAVDQAFVCGPHAMNDEVEAALREAGVEPARVHVERFGVPPAERAAAAEPQPGDATTARITLVRDGLTREFGFTAADGNLLDAAARAGLDVPYSCKSGVCATCRAKLVEGQVRMARNFALEPADLAAGFVLTCQAHPLTERVVVSFDER